MRVEHGNGLYHVESVAKTSDGAWAWLDEFAAGELEALP